MSQEQDIDALYRQTFEDMIKEIYYEHQDILERLAIERSRYIKAVIRNDLGIPSRSDMTPEELMKDIRYTLNELKNSYQIFKKLSDCKDTSDVPQAIVDHAAELLKP